MKNIFQDDTLPSGTDLPPMPKNDSKNMPSRPKRQVTPPPMKRAMPQTVYVPVQPVAPQQAIPQQVHPQQVQPQQMPPQGAYQYIPVNPQYPPQAYPQQGAPYYPVYGNPQQPVYPQGVPYNPYPAYAPVPTPAPEQEEPKTEYDPGTRVLYQSPDFENKDGSSLPDNVGASFANTVMKNAQTAEKDSEAENAVEEISETPVRVEFEEVSVSTPAAPKKPPIIRSAPQITTQELTDEDIYTDSKTGAISFAAYNAINPSLDVEDFQQELPPYEEYDQEEYEEENDVTQEAEEVSSDDEKQSLSKFEIIRRVVLGVSIAAIVISAGMLLNEWRLSRENDNAMDDANDLIITESTTNKKDKDKTTTKAPTPEEQWAQIKEDYPNVLFPATIQLKYAKLYGENQDFVGYLSADGINLNLPVVQTDDDETYLKKNFYGSTTKYGCPFVTHLNNITYNHLDMNTVIFGHHMNNGTIFGALDKYKTLAGYKAAPVITFNTLYKDYQWKVIAAFITNGYVKDDNNYIFPYYFTNLSATYKMSAYLSELAQRSLYDTGVDVLPSDKLLTLSTCSHEFEDARFVVVARLVRDGESTNVDTSKAVVNSNPRYPQAYYSKKGKTNPYKNANRWIAD